MNQKILISVFAVFLFFAILTDNAYALSVTVTQPGADTDEVMNGRTFTVEASGWTGDCSQATISFGGCSSCSLSGENTQKTVGGGVSSVSWTTVSANQQASAQSISISLSGGCTLQQSSSSNFDIVLPPSLALTATTEASSINDEGTFDVNLNIVNSGETTANDLSFGVSGTGMSISSGCSSISSLDEDQNVGQSCSIKGSTPGTYTVTLTVSSTNADSSSDSLSMTVNSVGGTPGPGGTTPGSPGPSGAPAAQQERERVTEMKQIGLVPGVGLRNNMRLQQALERALGRTNMSNEARENMLRLSASVSSQMQLSKDFSSGDGKSNLSLTFMHQGQEMIRNFMVYDVVPKTFASSAGSITVVSDGARIEVVESDPEYLFVYPSVSPGDEITITYFIDEELSASVIDETSTEVYAESVEQVAEDECTVPGERRCSGSDAQECQDGQWVTIDTCAFGCIDGICRGVPAPTTEMDWVTVGGIAVIVIVVVVIVALYMTGLIQKPKRGGRGKGDFAKISGKHLRQTES